MASPVGSPRPDNGTGLGPSTPRLIPPSAAAPQPQPQQPQAQPVGAAQPQEPQAQLHIDPVGTHLNIAPLQRASRQIWRLHQPDDSVITTCQRDESVEHKYGARIDAVMNKFEERLAAEGHRVLTVYMNGRITCAPLGADGPIREIYLDIEDEDVKAMRSIFIDAGWPTDYTSARSAYIKGSNNGVQPFKQTTARIESSKEPLKQVVAALPGASQRIERFGRFRTYYTDFIQRKKRALETELTQVRPGQDKVRIDAIQKRIKYYEMLENKLVLLDDTVLEIALGCPIGGDDINAAAVDAANLADRLLGALKQRDGVRVDGFLTSVGKLLHIDSLSSGRNNALTAEEVVYACQIALASIQHPDPNTERAMYEAAKQRLKGLMIEFSQASKLYPENKLHLGADKLRDIEVDIPRLKHIQDTLESVLAKFLLNPPAGLDPAQQEAIFSHPQFKILWDGGPGAVLTEAEKEEARTALLAFN